MPGVTAVAFRVARVEHTHRLQAGRRDPRVHTACRIIPQNVCLDAARAGRAHAWGKVSLVDLTAAVTL